MTENPPRGIGEKSLATIREVALTKNLDYITAFEEAIKQKKFRNSKNTENFLKLLKSWYQLKNRINLGDLVQTIIEESGMIQYYEKDLNPENFSRIENIKEFIQSVIDYEQQQKSNNKQITLSEYLQDISLLTSSEEISDQISNQKGIQLMTLHNAKGLEFSVVFLTGLEEGILPHQFSMEDNIEEERRLVYVGITRAKKKLYISYVERRNRFGQVNYSAPSRFLEEMELLKIEKKINNLNDFMPKKYGLLSNTIQEEELNINERYFHEKFGEGILKEIEEVAGKKIITIEFFNGEKKRFLANRTPLRKITSQ